MKTSAFLILFAAVLLSSSCNKTERAVNEIKEEASTLGDVTFAKATFEGLARGDSSVAEKIDWPVFTSLGNNVGASYGAIASGVEKQQFVTNFITQFATSFRESGGSIEGFTNWRVVFHDSQKTEVASDSANGVLTVIVSERDNLERVSSINIVK